MPRFFKEHFNTDPCISGDDAHHIQKSLRMRVGESLVVCDTAGNDYGCTISGIQPDRIELQINSVKKTVSEPTVKVTLFQCLPKSDKMDSVVRQSVELGAYRIVPVISSRCVSIPDRSAYEKKVVRWQRIANEASGQSGRGILPAVENPISFADLKSRLGDFDASLLFYELGGISVGEAIAIRPDASSVAIIIGPEGGFSADEAADAKECGAVLCTLGSRILRTETAPLAALTAIMTLTENMS